MLPFSKSIYCLIISLFAMCLANEGLAQTQPVVSDYGSHLCAESDSLDSYFDQTTVTGFFGIDGSKQPQDFGVNANLGVAGSIAMSAPLWREQGIGLQVGTRAVFTGNAVQVFELLGESKDRFQNFTSVGLFKRFENRFAIGATYDWLNQESFDNFTLSQWRVRASVDVNKQVEIGVTINIADRTDEGSFNLERVTLEPVDQVSIYLRQRWGTGVITTFWLGVADEHSEENAVTGTLPVKTNQVLFGADIFAPLNHWMAIYGETNLVMPADTGAVDAFLGLRFAPQGIRRSRCRNNRFRSLLPVASNPSFTTNLSRR